MGRAPSSFGSIGFFVTAPTPAKRRPGISNLESSVEPERVRAAVSQRIGAYEAINRKEAAALREWESTYFLPLVDHLETHNGLRVLTWESCIDAISTADSGTGSELQRFYERCLTFGAVDDRAVNSGQ